MAYLMATTDGFYWRGEDSDPWLTAAGVSGSNVGGEWASLGECSATFCPRSKDPPVFLYRGIVQVADPLKPELGKKYTPDPSEPYASLSIDSAYNGEFGDHIHHACEHGGRHLISAGPTIWYSDPLDFLYGFYGNFVNIGNSDDPITGLYNLNGNLYVLKENSVWGGGGDYFEYTSTAFRRIISRQGTFHGCHCIAGGKILFCSYDGLYIMNGFEAVHVSKAIDRYWEANFNPDEAWLSYWDFKKWALIKLSDSADLLLFDLPSQRFYRVDYFNPKCATSSPTTRNLYFSEGDSVQTLSTTAPAAGPVQEIESGWHSMGNRFDTKYVTRIFPCGKNIDLAELYTRNEPYSEGTWRYSWGEPGSDNALIAPFIDGKEFLLKFSGDGDMILGDSFGVEHTNRRH